MKKTAVEDLCKKMGEVDSVICKLENVVKSMRLYQRDVEDTMNSVEPGVLWTYEVLLQSMHSYDSILNICDDVLGQAINELSAISEYNCSLQKDAAMQSVAQHD